jgi:hypothetical protein
MGRPKNPGADAAVRQLKHRAWAEQAQKLLRPPPPTKRATGALPPHMMRGMITLVIVKLLLH